MSEENVENVRRSWEEFQAGMERGDPGACLRFGTRGLRISSGYRLSSLKGSGSGAAARGWFSSFAPGPRNSTTGRFGLKQGASLVEGASKPR